MEEEKRRRPTLEPRITLTELRKTKAYRALKLLYKSRVLKLPRRKQELLDCIRKMKGMKTFRHYPAAKPPRKKSDLVDELMQHKGVPEAWRKAPTEQVYAYLWYLKTRRHAKTKPPPYLLFRP